MACADTPLSLLAVSASHHDFIFRLFSVLKTDELQAWAWEEQMRQAVLRIQFEAHERHYRANFPGAEDSLIRLNETLVGRLIVLRSGKALHLADLALLPEFRGQGIGGTLIRKLQLEATAEGVPVRLNCFAGNRARRLYERLGFAVVTDSGTHVSMEWRK